MLGLHVQPLHKSQYRSLVKTKELYCQNLTIFLRLFRSVPVLSNPYHANLPTFVPESQESKIPVDTVS